jgi:hypothetical protein
MQANFIYPCHTIVRFQESFLGQLVDSELAYQQMTVGAKTAQKNLKSKIIINKE